MKGNNVKFLTFNTVRDIILYKSSEIKKRPNPTWGYSREMVGKMLDNLILELENKCQNN